MSTKSGSSNGAQPMIVSEWRKCEKGTLVGFFTLTTPSGYVFHELMLHEKGSARWIKSPAREWLDQQGKKHYAPPFLDFVDRARRSRFQAQVLQALDEHLASNGAPELDEFFGGAQ